MSDSSPQPNCKRNDANNKSIINIFFISNYILPNGNATKALPITTMQYLNANANNY